MDPVPAVRFPNGRDAKLGRELPPSFSFFLKILENIFLKFPEDVGKRGFSPLSKVDRRGDVFGENVLEVNDDRGNAAEKMEETELEEECPWPELERGEWGSDRASDGGLLAADLGWENVTGEDIGRGIVLWPDGGRGRAALGDTF